ncbi:MAG: ComEC/Rec2 family competence protein [Christensenellales bacterium]
MKKILACVAALATGCIMALTGSAARAQDVTVTFYDMGKADAALITAEDGSRILIDAGTNKGGKKLAERFAEEGIERLDAMIITHFDKDHVGGADKILESVSVARVILPQYEKESKQYAQFMEALEQSAQTEREILPAGGEWSEAFGQTRLRVTAAERTDYGADEENDFSLATYLTYGETKFLFPGDAEDARQTELLHAGDDRPRDVLKGAASRGVAGVTRARRFWRPVRMKTRLFWSRRASRKARPARWSWRF